MDNIDIKKTAIALVMDDVSAFEEAQCYVTDKISFHMRNLIKRLRKNFWGIFDDPLDDITGREKTWVPLTESVVESVVKNCDLDTKDINFRAKKVESIGLTAIVRNAVRGRLDEIFIGEYLDELVQALAIDGTAVWKTYEKYSNGKKKLVVKFVDLLNFYIDPTARSIAEASSVVERSILTKDEFMSHDWINKDDVAFKSQINRNDRLAPNNNSETEYVEVYERWGIAPLALKTGKDKDKDEMVEMRVIVSKSAVHLLELNTKKDKNGGALRPYEECWYSRIPGRWYGRGPAERILMLQSWLNTLVNIRINRSMVAQLGIFKIKRNAGITPQMISKLPTNGAISVQDMGDIEQMVMQEASQSSYLDEDRVQSWAGRVTSSFEAVTGEQLPASTPATNAVLQARSAQNSFTRVKEGIGLFLERWMTRHALPIVQKNINVSDIVRLSGEADEINDYIDRVVNEYAYQKMEKMNMENMFFDPEQALKEIERSKEQLRRKSKDLFMELRDKIDLSDFDVKVDITNESVDKGVLVQNLLSVLQTAAAAPEAGIDVKVVLRQIFDIMGLDPAQLERKDMNKLAAPTSQGALLGMPGMPQGMPTEQSTVTAANVPQFA